MVATYNFGSVYIYTISSHEMATSFTLGLIIDLFPLVPSTSEFKYTFSGLCEKSKSNFPVTCPVVRS